VSEFFHHVVLHTLLEAVKIIPFLFLAYLLMEYLEHRAGNSAERLLGGSGKVGPLIGGALGALPQCGFSAAAAGLYSGRIITLGTLIAVCLSTSDEMLPIMISRIPNGLSVGFILAVLGGKLLIGVLAGFCVDLILRAFACGKGEQTPQIEELCERERCNCGGGFWGSALKHTLYTSLFLIAVIFALNTVIFCIGEERLAALVLDKPILSNLLAATLGLIPNCASSVLLTELHLSGVISLGSMFSGLLANAGVGTVVLFRQNRPVWDSLRVIALLWGIGALVGLLMDLTPISQLLLLLK
jgi:hypothetical protein